MWLLSAVLLISANLVASQEPPEHPISASILWNAKEGFRYVEGPEALNTHDDKIAWATYTNAINSTGWAYLEVSTAASFPDRIQVMSFSTDRGRHMQRKKWRENILVAPSVI